MTHFTAEATRSQATPRAWLRVGAAIGEQTNTWADRNDIVAYVGPGAGGEAPACFKPTIAEMEINVDVAFAPGLDPKYVEDMTERRTQFDWPLASGAILHEAMHARHSLWSFEELYEHPKPLVQKLTTLFEESRIEARGVERFPENRSFLRACALGIVLKDLKPEEITANGYYGLSHLMLLTLARVDAGVLEPEDVELVHDKATEVLGAELLERLRLLWKEAQAHNLDHQVAPLMDIAERWLELMAEDDKDMEQEQEEMDAALAAALGEIIEALGGMAEDVEAAAATEGDIQIRKEIREAEVKAIQEAAREEKNHKDISDDNYAKASSDGPFGRTGSELLKKRKPEVKERAAAANIGRMLEKAKYHDRIVTEHHSAVPPGKMRMQAVMQGHIERSRGSISTVEPFKSKRRHHAEDPNLTVGVMVDISGSMRPAMTAMGVTAWLLSEASRRIDARCAMTYFGQSVFPVLRPGQHLDEVRIYSAPDGTEEFDQAFKVTDGALNLLHGSGARLLVICSDMAYRWNMIPRATKWVQRCSQAGVGVLILPYDGGYNAADYGKIPGVQIVTGSLDPVSVAGTIGMAAVKALEAAGAGR